MHLAMQPIPCPTGQVHLLVTTIRLKSEFFFYFGLMANTWKQKEATLGV